MFNHPYDVSKLFILQRYVLLVAMERNLNMFYPPFSFPTFYISPGKQTCECRSTSEGYVVTDDAIILCLVSGDTRGVFLFKSFCCKKGEHEI